MGVLVVLVENFLVERQQLILYKMVQPSIMQQVVVEEVILVLLVLVVSLKLHNLLLYLLHQVVNLLQMISGQLVVWVELEQVEVVENLQVVLDQVVVVERL